MRPSRPILFFLVFGLYLTLRGYHSRDGDQGHRLPLLLHQQDPSLYFKDPFIRAFEVFNPHRGSLAVMDLASRPLGLSFGIFGLFGLTLAGTCRGVDRMARAIWPGRAGVGWVAVLLVLIAKAGNIGTNHLFEAMLLDRLMAMALAWTALAAMVENPNRAPYTSALWIGLAGVIHPSLGLQLAAVVGGSWVVWGLIPRSGVRPRPRSSMMGVLTLFLAMIPTLALMAGSSTTLLDGLPAEEFRLLSVDLQSPQHMMPHLWRSPQWHAWFAYLVVAAISLKAVPAHQTSGGEPDASQARMRLALMLVVTLIGLALAYVAIEIVGDLRVTLFQPFRLATLARGLALVIIAGHVFDLWSTGDLIHRGRAILLTIGLTGDRSMAVATCVELVFSLGLPRLGLFTLAGGLFFLSQHDTESGHVPILSALVLICIVQAVPSRGLFVWNRKRLWLALIVAWVAPGLAMLAPILPPKLAQTLAYRWRFAAIAVDDIEKLGLWCSEHVPKDAMFIAPPGPKTFRLWSRRSLAFNRAGSPYHAAGLANWAGRYRDHLGFEGTTHEFVKAYQADRHGIESRYETMSDQELCELAARQGGTYVIASSRRNLFTTSNRLLRLHAEGAYAVYQVVNDNPLD